MVVEEDIMMVASTRRWTAAKSRLRTKQIPGVLGSLGSKFALYASAGLSLSAALIHLRVMSEHLAEWWGYGVFFLLVALAQGLYGVALLRWPRRPLMLAGMAGNLAIVVLYIGTRTAGVPFLGPDAWTPEGVGTLDLTAVAIELTLVFVLLAQTRLLSAARVYVTLGVAQAFGVGLVQYLTQWQSRGADGVSPLVGWLQFSLLSLPLSILAVWLATPLAYRLTRWFQADDESASGTFFARAGWAATVAPAYALASVSTDGLVARYATANSLFPAALRSGALVFCGSLICMLVLASVRGTPWEKPRVIDFWRPRAFAVTIAAATALAIVAGPSLLGIDFSSKAVAQQAPAGCSAATYDRSYEVAAISVEIPYNRWGNSDPDGQVFVLQGDKEAVKNWFRPLAADPANDSAGNRRLRPRPLVLRANVGECLKVKFTNELNATGGSGLPNNPRASIKVFGPAYNPQTSDGSAVGYNKDTTVGIGESISYFWKVPDEEGIYLFRDQGATAGSEANSGSLSHGLYGALAVEPPGSTWTDPNTGQPLYAGSKDHKRITKQSGDPYIDADIHPAGTKSFRESIQLTQDEFPGDNGMGLNYGAEQQKNRVPSNLRGNGSQLAPDSVGEETSLSSWTYGDPALVKLASGKGPWLPAADRRNKEDCGLESQPGGGSCYTSNVVRSYPGDPTKIRFMHAGVKETHVFHMHAHQWRAEDKDEESTIIDSQTYSPGEGFTADLLFGAGSEPGTFGDSIFHCHLYPHFADGFWSLFRVHDVREDGTNKTPDNVNVRNLEPLPNGVNPPQATVNNPGYPRFIPGRLGWRAPQPPGGVSETDPSVTDNPNTVEREDLKPITRTVGGKFLDPNRLDLTNPEEKELADKLAVEKQVIERNTGPNFNPGAPFAEPCRPGSREVTYNVSAIQTDIVYNERGDHDTQGRIMVLDKDVDDVLAGRKEPEPFFFRANVGDCVNFNLTNRLPNWIGADAFQKLVQTNMVGEHIHLVKFDVLASDGASNGWNYQQAAFSKEQADFTRRAASDNLSPGENCDENGCRIAEPASWNPNTSTAPGAAPGQTISERWYADTELRTVFSHDHQFAAQQQQRGLFTGMIVEPKGMDFRNPKTGEFYQPIDDPNNGPVCGTECNATADGTSMDVIGSGAKDDFREFSLAAQDFVSLTKKGGNPANAADTINPPNEPEEFPDDDPGTMAFNYKNAPLKYRQTKNGQPTDPAYGFSSTVHGDPKTPLLEAYSEDPVRIRLIQGAMEEQHVFKLNGMRWRQEPDDPDSPLINSQAIGVSDAFNFQVPKIPCGANDTKCMGDYLYSSATIDDTYLGMWGIMRAYGKVDRNRLLPLPDNIPPAQGRITVSPQALEPPDANSPGNPCPTGAPTKKFNVVAMEAKLQYNKSGDNDPYGLIYALSEDVQAIRNGSIEPEPLVLRANEGDCIEVRLTNKLTRNFLKHKGIVDGDAEVPTEPATGTRAGLRVSLSPQLVKYDVRGSDGTAVGFNRDQTVGPGGSKLYRWYADDVSPGELGTTNLFDFGDVRGHRHHGLFAGLNIEPKGSTYRDPATGARIKSGAAADIRVPGANNDFREFTTFFQDGLNLRNKNGAIIKDPSDPPPPGEPVEELDAEDQGEKGFNYANAPFNRRIGENMDGMAGAKMANVFNSKLHGDPDTPIFRAYAGDPVRVRLLQGADKPRQNTFQLSGHSWRAQPHDPGSTTIGAQGGMSVSRTFNLHLSGAGGGYAGDYRYGSGINGFHLWGGQWGIMRIYPKMSGAAALKPTPLRTVDNPYSSGNHPILPLETNAALTRLGGLKAKPATVTFGKVTTLSGNLSSGRQNLANQPVILEHRPAGVRSFRKLTQKSTDRAGNFSFSGIKPMKNTEYRVSFAGNEPSGLRPSTSPTMKIKVRALVTAKLSTKSIKRGKVLVASGLVTPRHTGRVKLTIKQGKKIVVNKAVPLRNSRYSYRYKTRRPGRYTIQASFAGDRDHLGAKSPLKKFRVTR